MARTASVECDSEGPIRIVQKEIKTEGKEVEAVVCLGTMNVQSVFRVMGNVYGFREKRNRIWKRREATSK